MRKLFCLTGLVLFLVGPGVGAWAKSPLIEIVALSHWPVQEALKPVREMLANYSGEVEVVETDAESREGVTRLRSLGLKGHVPLAVLVDGDFRALLPGGRPVKFVGFPANANSPMGLSGSWSAADLENVLTSKLR